MRRKTLRRLPRDLKEFAKLANDATSLARRINNLVKREYDNRILSPYEKNNDK